jgi:hypothetical protein
MLAILILRESIKTMSRVLRTRLLMKPLPDTEYERNGVLVPGSKDQGKAEIVKAGPDCFCKPGEEVLYNRNAAVPVELKSGSYITMIENEHNILVILEEDK